jgi:hypothetical protein
VRLRRLVIPAKAGIYNPLNLWIPAFAGMTRRVFFHPQMLDVVFFSNLLALVAPAVKN